MTLDQLVVYNARHVELEVGACEYSRGTRFVNQADVQALIGRGLYRNDYALWWHGFVVKYTMFGHDGSSVIPCWASPGLLLPKMKRFTSLLILVAPALALLHPREW
jgi:hypothetical protein